MDERGRPAARAPGTILGLVLGGGGARGAYQAGVLARIAEGADHEYPFPVITGVSAGAINATAVAASPDSLEQAVRQLTDAWLRLTVDKVFRSNFTALSASLLHWSWVLGTGGVTPGFRLRSLLDTEPLRRYLSKTLDLRGLRRNILSGRLRALALSATSYSTGNTVTFVEGVPGLVTWERARRQAVLTEIGLDHVLASAALPLVFPAIQMGEDSYGDGSIRQGSPLAPAIHLGADRVLAISVRYQKKGKEKQERQVTGYPPPAQILGMLMHGVFLDSLENDAERLERINRTLQVLPSGLEHPDGLRPIHLLVLRPSEDLGKLAAGLLKYLPRPLRILARGLGASQTTTPDFLSYLLFEPPYLERLIELGYRDATARWDQISRFLQI